MCFVSLQNDAGRSNQLFLAIARSDGEYGECYYVDRPPRACRELDLRRESARIEKMIRAAVRTFASARRRMPVRALVVEFSVDEGLVHVSLDTTPGSEPGAGNKMSHFRFRTQLVASWPTFFAAGERLIGLDGRACAKIAGRTIRWQVGTRRQSADETIGGMLVSLVTDLRRRGVFTKLIPAAKATLGVEEQDGAFGWPPYARRHRDGWLAPM
jgi:hypothetical protein